MQEAYTHDAKSYSALRQRPLSFKIQSDISPYSLHYRFLTRLVFVVCKTTTNFVPTII